MRKMTKATIHQPMEISESDLDLEYNANRRSVASGDGVIVADNVFTYPGTSRSSVENVSCAPDGQPDRQLLPYLVHEWSINNFDLNRLYQMRSVIYSHKFPPANDSTLQFSLRLIPNNKVDSKPCLSVFLVLEHKHTCLKDKHIKFKYGIRINAKEAPLYEKEFNFIETNCDGFEMFISHEKLQDQKYLNDSTLRLICNIEFDRDSVLPLELNPKFNSHWSSTSNAQFLHHLSCKWTIDSFTDKLKPLYQDEGKQLPKPQSILKSTVTQLLKPFAFANISRQASFKSSASTSGSNAKKNIQLFSDKFFPSDNENLNFQIVLIIDNEENSPTKENISLYVKFESKTVHYAYVYYRMSILDFDQQSYATGEHHGMVLFRNDQCKGVPKFIPLEEVLNIENGLLYRNALIILLEVEIVEENVLSMQTPHSVLRGSKYRDQVNATSQIRKTELTKPPESTPIVQSSAGGADLSQNALKRLKEELAKYLESPDNQEFCHIEPGNENFSILNCKLFGIENTPYEEGTFELKVYIPYDYPSDPPNVSFSTRIWHPNISSMYAVWLSVLRDQWSSDIKIANVLMGIRSLINSPEMDNPIDTEVARQYLKTPILYYLTARYWTYEFAIELKTRQMSNEFAHFDELVNRLMSYTNCEKFMAIYALSCADWELYSAMKQLAVCSKQESIKKWIKLAASNVAHDYVLQILKEKYCKLQVKIQKLKEQMEWQEQEIKLLENRQQRLNALEDLDFPEKLIEGGKRKKPFQSQFQNISHTENSEILPTSSPGGGVDRDFRLKRQVILRKTSFKLDPKSMDKKYLFKQKFHY